MAAELFRARYAEEPFVSLFVTGRDLHIFSNCETVRLERDDAPTVDLQEAPHHIVKLEGAFTGVRAEGVRKSETIRKVLHPWGEAATVAITIDEAEAKAGRTIALDLTIVDNAGMPVRDWNGHVEVEVDGDAQLLAYTGVGEVLMARGEGRTYVKMGRSGEEAVIHATANGLEPASSTISPRR